MTICIHLNSSELTRTASFLSYTEQMHIKQNEEFQFWKPKEHYFLYFKHQDTFFQKTNKQETKTWVLAQLTLTSSSGFTGMFRLWKERTLKITFSQHKRNTSLVQFQVHSNSSHKMSFFHGSVMQLQCNSCRFEIF